MSRHSRRTAEPIGPTSLTWKYFGDWRALLVALWAGTMQSLHPVIGRAVEQHSNFFDERWQRLLRSMYAVNGVVYDGGRSPTTGRRVRDYHRTITGKNADGTAYHALDPDVFYWAHATFFMATILLADNFCGGISEADKRRLFDEHVHWYRNYGVSMRPVPASWEEFQDYWKHVCTEVLELNPAARAVLDLRTLAKPPAWQYCPDLLWRLIRPAVAKFQLWLTAGLLDPEVRTLLSLEWSDRDARRLRRLGWLIHTLFSLLPPSRRMHPRALAGWSRATGRIAVDAPLVETPKRNLETGALRAGPRRGSTALPVDFRVALDGPPRNSTCRLAAPPLRPVLLQARGRARQ
jgi:uncharacterized protein (DUF2236 family)